MIHETRKCRQCGEELAPEMFGAADPDRCYACRAAAQGVRLHLAWQIASSMAYATIGLPRPDEMARAAVDTADEILRYMCDGDAQQAEQVKG